MSTQLAQMTQVGSDAAKTSTDGESINILRGLFSSGGLFVASFVAAGFPDLGFYDTTNPVNLVLVAVGLSPGLAVRKTALRKIFSSRLVGIMRTQPGVAIPSGTRISRKSTDILDSLCKKQSQEVIPLSDVLDIPESRGKLLVIEKNVFTIMEELPAEVVWGNALVAWDNALKAVVEIIGLDLPAPQPGVILQKNMSFPLTGTRDNLDDDESFERIKVTIQKAQQQLAQQREQIMVLEAEIVEFERKNKDLVVDA